jgi:hypothetical protein
MRAEDLASRIMKARRSGDNYTGRCPGHQDEQASLSWTNGTDSLLIKCHAGCALETIARALGLTMRALLRDGFPERERPSKGVPIVAEYRYVSADGQLQYVVVRRADKTFFQKRPDPAEPGKRVVEVPIASPAGHLVTTPGYDARARVVYAPPPGFTMPAIPQAPTAEDIRQARDLILTELLGDFPFVSPADRAHAVTMLLTPLVRSLIPGPVPLHLIEKPAPRTGATLLIETIGAVLTGCPLPIMTEAEEEEEWRKRLTSVLLNGPMCLVLDNLHRPLNSAALSALLTAEIWQDRILGRSEVVRLRMGTVIFATANNPGVSREITGRVVPCRIDAEMEHPETRTGFRHSPLVPWVRAHRGEILAAALTLVQAWLVAGRPAGDTDGPVLGGFEAYVDVLGGLLKTAGIGGFLGNRAEFTARADTESPAIKSFLTCWWTRHKTAPVYAKQLLPILDDEACTLVLDAKSDQGRLSRLGRLLARLEDQFHTLEVGNKEVEVAVKRAGTHANATQWVLAQPKKRRGQAGESGESSSGSQDTKHEDSDIGGLGEQGDLGDLGESFSSFRGTRARARATDEHQGKTHHQGHQGHPDPPPFRGRAPDMTAQALMTELHGRGVSLSLDGDILVIRPVSRVTPEEIAALRYHKAEILALLQRQAPPAPVGETPRTVTTKTTEWAARGGRDGRTGLPRSWSPARFTEAALSSFGFDNHWIPWEAIAHAIGLGHAWAWCWIPLELETAGLLERQGTGGAEDPWRFRRRVETSSPPRNVPAPGARGHTLHTMHTVAAGPLSPEPAGPDLAALTTLAMRLCADGDPTAIPGFTRRLAQAEATLRTRLRTRRTALSRDDAIGALKDTGLSMAEARALFYARAGRSWFDAGGAVVAVRAGRADGTATITATPTGEIATSWPSTLNGAPRQIGPLTSCAKCGAGTFVRYCEVASCLSCVLRVAELHAPEVASPAADAAGGEADATGQEFEDEDAP